MFKRIKFKQSYWIVFGGNILEFYDVTLYGFLLAKLQSLFFPPSSFSISYFNYLAFAAAYLARPVGGLLIGYIADHYRRELALKLSILLAAIPTIFVGLIPTYEQWGLWATFALLMCRMLQGLCLGGEYAAVTTYIYENTSPKYVNFVTSILNASNFLGALMATIVGVLVTQPYMPEWSWRGAFLLGGCLSLIILRKRQAILKGIQKTSGAIVKSKKPSYFSYIWNNRVEFLRTLVVGGLSSAPYMIFTIFLTNYLGDTIGLVIQDRIYMSMGICVAYIVFYPFCGYYADMFGNKATMTFGCYALAITGLVSLYLIPYMPLWLIFCVQVLMSILSMIFSSGANSFLANIYPKEVRCRGMTVSLTLGGALFGALSPTLGQFFVHNGFGIAYLGVYLALLCVLGVISVNSGEERGFVLKSA